MFTVYVLKSIKNSKRYVGYTGKSYLERLKEHNKGNNDWTRCNKPFIIVHQKIFSSKT